MLFLQRMVEPGLKMDYTYLIILRFFHRLQCKKPHWTAPVRQVTFFNYFLLKRFGAVRLPSKPDFGIGFAVCSNLGAL